MALIVLRHTEPVGHAGLCYGRLDLALQPDFERHAAQIARDLPEVEAIVTSPLSRARRLADWIGASRGLPVRVEARITEMDFGAWEGRPWAEIPRAEIDAWAEDLMGADPHGGETVQALAQRVAAALADCAPQTLIVAHAGVAKAALAWAGAPDPWDHRLAFGDWIALA